MFGPREEERDRTLRVGSSGPGNSVRRCQGGGEAPPRMFGPREEERDLTLRVGSSGPGIRCGDTREEERCRRECLVPGRRRGTAHCVSGHRDPEIACGDAREEERHRRECLVPGRRRGTAHFGWVIGTRNLGAATPGRRRVPPLCLRVNWEEIPHSVEAFAPFVSGADPQGRRRGSAPVQAELGGERSGLYSQISLAACQEMRPISLRARPRSARSRLLSDASSL